MAPTPARTIHPGTLKSPTDFQTVFRNGVKIRSGSFHFYGARNGLTTARLGLSVAKKEVSKAVKRNRLKRLIRESFRRQFASLNGLDVVVVARRPAAALNNATVAEQLALGWSRLAQTEPSAKQANPPSHGQRG